MRVIVTGGNGRAGMYTVRELARANHETVNVDIIRLPTDLPGHFIQLDLTNAGEVYDAFVSSRRVFATSRSTQPLRLPATTNFREQRLDHAPCAASGR
jgi:nucleoside-diphosphate-sugar epimerase